MASIKQGERLEEGEVFIESIETGDVMEQESGLGVAYSEASDTVRIFAWFDDFQSAGEIVIRREELIAKLQTLKGGA
jgi:hypothetical protein